MEPAGVGRETHAETRSVGVVEVEVVCSDAAEHRRRVETRVADVPGLVLPTWDGVQSRDYAAWDRPRAVVDTAALTAEEAAAAVLRAVPVR